MAGIYIHIPFCKQACYYCDFHFSTSLKRRDEMVQAIVKELVLRRKYLEGELVETIYFGGGTPSLLCSDEIKMMLDAVSENFELSDAPEITLEANPDDLSLKKIKELADLPVNRLSIGIQSFFEDDLQFMNRAHNAKESEKCLEEALKFFDNITIDLIYGVPGMSNKKWKANLDKTFQFGIPHISSYALTVEERTALFDFIKKGKVPPIDEELALQHFELLVAETQKQGLLHYEISNFGKPGYFSKHNTSYWKGKKYLGVGPSAHSFNGKERAWNISNNTKYMKSLGADILPLEIENLSKNDRYNEYIMTGLRTIWGVSLGAVEREFGSGYLESLETRSRQFIEQGLLELKKNESSKELSEDRLLLTTHKGKFLADGIASDLFIINDF